MFMLKEKLAKEAAIGARHVFGWWSVFELKDEPPQRTRVLSYRPALVVSALKLKLRGSNEWSFTRLTEEQFADGWFDVLLAHSPESKIDRLNHLEQFGALVVEAYDFDDLNRAYDVLKAWSAIHLALDKSKLPVGHADDKIQAELTQNKISITTQPGKTDEPVPVLIANTFHPNWRREDGETIYPSTPFYMLTFIDAPVRLIYGRVWYERLAIWVSGGTLAFMYLWFFLSGVRQWIFAEMTSRGY